MSTQLNSRSFGLVLVSLAWAAFLTIIGSPEVLLFTVPVFMLAAPLAMGRYVGDGLIDKLTQIGRSRRRSRVVAIRVLPVFASAVRGSRLIASNLAGRAPPVLAS